MADIYHLRELMALLEGQSEPQKMNAWLHYDKASQVIRLSLPELGIAIALPRMVMDVAR